MNDETVADRHVVKLALIEKAGDLAQALAKWGSLAFIFWCCYLSIDSLAGKYTWANIDIDAKASGSITTTENPPTQNETNSNLSNVQQCEDINAILIIGSIISLVAGFGGIVYGKSQAKALKVHIETHASQQIELEKLIDPGRTSSNLGANGDTRPEDA